MFASVLRAMAGWRRWFTFSYLIIGTMAAALGTLAWLQYRWSDQVGRAEREEMRSGLNAAIGSFHSAFYRELIRVCSEFQGGAVASGDDANEAARVLAGAWLRSNLARELVRAVYVAEPVRGGTWRLLGYDPTRERFAPAASPAWLQPLERQFDDVADFLENASPRQWHFRPWSIDVAGGVLFRAIISAPPNDEEENRDAYRLLGFLMLELNQAYLEKEYLPELAHRWFGPGEDRRYRVAVFRGDTMVYRSEPGITAAGLAQADAEADLLRPPEPPRGLRGRPGLGFMPGPILRLSPDGPEWRVVAQHRAGSLDAAVARLRHRSLAISFGVLLLLAASLGFVLISAHRAKELARLQMDFVAGISHELRTPVAAVAMVADNLAEDVVQSPQQVRQYGVLLRQQARRLRTMVEQTLLFAAHQRGRSRFELRSMSVAEAAAAAVADETPLLEAAGMTVEQDFPGDLPKVVADRAALKHCIENLLSNACKYASDGGWVGVRAEAVAGREPEVRLTVEDRGPGIDTGERDRVFQPFYRGAAAREAQIPGNGLGLSLVKRIVEGMGGRITMRTEPGRGCAFTLHLPAEPAGRPAEEVPELKA